MSESGAIVLGWLTKVVVSLSLLGLVTFDGIALVTANFSVADHANLVANVAADDYKLTHNAQMAFNAASEEALKNDEIVDDRTFVVRTDTGHVTLTLRKTAVTLWMKYIGPLKRFTKVSAEGEGRPPL